MAELRWVLLALGVLVVTGVYLWSRGFLKRTSDERARRRSREEPRISLETDLLSKPSNVSDEAYSAAGDEVTSERRGKPGSADTSAASPAAGKKTAPRHAPEKIVTIRFVPKSHELDGHEAVLALRDAGLEHGRYGIFHKHREAGRDEDVLFSVASLTEPGTFDLANLGVISGMSFFIALPSAGDPVECFDAMVETARSIAHRLDSDLFDDRGSSWSIQRERYVREELIRYRHQYYVH
jgi:cell division protein ZipA